MEYEHLDVRDLARKFLLVTFIDFDSEYGTKEEFETLNQKQLMLDIDHFNPDDTILKYNLIWVLACGCSMNCDNEPDFPFICDAFEKIYEEGESANLDELSLKYFGKTVEDLMKK